MNGFTFQLQGARLTALSSGALWWPERRLLTVSDLHFGKARRAARRGGQLLPPYEVAETLFRLETVVDALRPATVIALGDSFDDAAAADEIFSVLMGEDVESRRGFIQRNAKDVRFLDI